MFLPKIRKVRFLINTTAGVVITVFFISSLISAVLLATNRDNPTLVKIMAVIDPGGVGGGTSPHTTLPDTQEWQREREKEKNKDLSKLLQNINIPQPPYNTGGGVGVNTQGLVQNMNNPQPPYNTDGRSANDSTEDKHLEMVLKQIVSSVPNDSKPPSAEPCALGMATSSCFCSANYCYWNDSAGKTHQISKKQKGTLTAVLTILDFAGALSSKYGKIYIDTDLDGSPDELATEDNLVNNPYIILGAVSKSLNMPATSQTKDQNQIPSQSQSQSLPNLRSIILTSNVQGSTSSVPRQQINIPLSHIAATVFAEASNGTDPVSYQSLMAWVLLNRASAGTASTYTQALAPMLSSILGNWSGMTLEQATQEAIDRCLQNPDKCPSQSSRFSATLSIVQEIYNQFLNGVPDPTGGSLFFSKQSNLNRGNLSFKSSTELQIWLAQMASNYAQKKEGFRYLITEPFVQNVWSASKGIQSTGKEQIMYICNDPCCADASCK